MYAFHMFLHLKSNFITPFYAYEVEDLAQQMARGRFLHNLQQADLPRVQDPFGHIMECVDLVDTPEANEHQELESTRRIWLLAWATELELYVHPNIDYGEASEESSESGYISDTFLSPTCSPSNSVIQLGTLTESQDGETERGGSGSSSGSITSSRGRTSTGTSSRTGTCTGAGISTSTRTSSRTRTCSCPPPIIETQSTVHTNPFLVEADRLIHESLKQKDEMRRSEAIGSHHEALARLKQGHIEKEWGNFKQAEDYFQASLKIQRANAGKAESLNVADPLLCIGMAILKPDWKADFFRRSLDITRSSPCTAEKDHDLEETLRELKDVIAKQGREFQESQFDDSHVHARSGNAVSLNEEGMRKFEEFYRAMLENLNLEGFDKAMTLRALAIVKRCQANYKESVHFFLQSLNELELQDADPDDLKKRFFCVVQAELGMVKARQGQSHLEEAEALLEDVHKKIQQWLLGCPDDPKKLLAVLLHELAIVKRKQDKLPEAEACLDECEKLELAVSATSNSQSIALSLTLLERGIVMRQGGNLAKARDCLQKSITMQLNLAGNTARSEEAFHKKWLGSILYARGKWQKAKDMLRESREIYHPEICWLDQWLDRLDFEQQEYGREADVRGDQTPIQKLREIQKLRFRNYGSETTIQKLSPIQKLRFRNYPDSETTVQKLRFRNYCSETTAQKLRLRKPWQPMLSMTQMQIQHYFYQTWAFLALATLVFNHNYISFINKIFSSRDWFGEILLLCIL